MIHQQMQVEIEPVKGIIKSHSLLLSLRANMKNLSATLATCLLFCASVAVAQIQSGVEYDVYFLAGQSNAAGRGDAAELPNINNGFYAGVQTDVQLFWRSTLITDIGNLTQNEFVPLQVDAGEGRNSPGSHEVEFGPEIALGRTLADGLPGRNIVIVKYAHGGSNLHTDWAPGGIRYTTFLDVVSDALSDISSAGGTANLRGFAWVQGESDTSAANSVNYATNLTNLISRVRTDVFGGEQAQVVVSRLSDNQYNSLNSNINTVRAAQVSVADNDPAVEWLDTDGAEFSTYNISNPIHFDAQGVLAVGTAIGSAFLDDAGPADPSPGVVIFNADPGDVSGTSNVNAITNNNNVPGISGSAGDITVTLNGDNFSNQGIASQDNISSLLGRPLADTDTVTMTFVLEETSDIIANGIELGLSPNGTGFRPEDNLSFAIDADGGNSGLSIGNVIGLSNRVLGFGFTEASVIDGFTLTLTANAEGYVFEIMDVVTTEPTAQTSAQFAGAFTGNQFLDIFSTGHIYGTVQQGTPTRYSEFSIAINAGLLGDFEPDGDVDIDDVDFYVGNIGATATGALLQLDLNSDGTIDLEDRRIHIETYVQTSNGQTGTFLGDLNLDGEVDVLGDAFVLVSNLNNPVTSYADGDINFDGVVDVLSDAFVLIANLGQSNAP